MSVPRAVLLLGVACHAGEVREFGARGDGATDDAAAIQRAVEAGGAVRFSAGTYRLTRPVVIDLEAAGPVALAGDSAVLIRMEGAGPAFDFVGTLDQSGNPANIPDEFWGRQLMPAMEGLAIVGVHPEAVGLRAKGTMQLTITRCHFRRLLHGIHLIERNRNVLIGECHVYDNRGAGIFLDDPNLHQINIGNSHISYNRGGGVVVRAGSVRNLQISGCDIEANMHPESSPTANILLDSTGGSIAEVEITGCTIQHYHHQAGSANIRVIGEGVPVRGSTERKWGQLVVSGNVINDAAVNLHLVDVRAAIVSGNTIHRGKSHDILVERSSRVVLSGNVLDRHAGYADDPTMAQGVVFRDSADCLITGLHIQGGHAPAAVAVHGGRRFHIANCTIADVPGIGLLLENVSASFVHGNLIDVGDVSRVAIRVSGGGGNTIRDNHLAGRFESK